METKEEFFKSLEEIVEAELFIGSTFEEFEEEAKANHWSISLTSELAKKINAIEILEFLKAVKANRKQQLIQRGFSINLFFYMWFDEQSGTLNFSFIDSTFTRLPFKCTLKLVKSELEIIDDFLQSKYLDGIPWDELTDNTELEDSNQEEYVLKVFKELITKN
ncbi:MAG TPA: hypothetical protein VEC36_02995 [Patescibacteria group bacterium]|nr:hypothetical protein [Patescibacteria group bacterium]